MKFNEWNNIEAKWLHEEREAKVIPLQKKISSSVTNALSKLNRAKIASVAADMTPFVWSTKRFKEAHKWFEYWSKVPLDAFEKKTRVIGSTLDYLWRASSLTYPLHQIPELSMIVHPTLSRWGYLWVYFTEKNYKKFKFDNDSQKAIIHEQLLQSEHTPQHESMKQPVLKQRER